MSLYSKDAYCTKMSIADFVGYVHQEKWHLYNVLIEGDMIYFEAPLDEYFKITKHNSIQYLKTIGLAGYIRRFLSNRKNWFSLIAAVLAVFIYTNVIWEVEVLGDDDLLEEKIVQSLYEEGISRYSFFVNDNSLLLIEERLRSIYFEEIEWLNIMRKGDSIKVLFMPRQSAIKEEMGYEPIVSKKEAVIAYFEVESGKKLVQINDYVKIGDVLVTSNIIDSFGNPKKTFVKGKVYGYTLYVLERELIWPYEQNSAQAFAYFRLLFDLRTEIAKEIAMGEKIIEENILHFSLQEGTIRMKIQYTLYEDITKP